MSQNWKQSLHSSKRIARYMEQKGTYIPAATITETLQALPQEGKRLLEPLKAAGLPINILEDVAVANAPEIHLHEDDLWICISGEVTFLVGGEVIGAYSKVKKDGTQNLNEITGERIEGGEQYTLHPGDILHIPAGVPHSHGAEGAARLYIIKIPKE